MASSNMGSRAKLTLECPFDLETVFTMQYSTDGLKGVLKWIIENMGEMRTDLTSTTGDVSK